MDSNVLDELGVSDLMDQALAEGDKAVRRRLGNEVSQMSERQLYERLSVLLKGPQTEPIDPFSFGLSPEEVEFDLICHEILGRKDLSNCRCQGAS